MEIKESDYELFLSQSDIEQIRFALREWGKSEDIVSNFNGIDVHKYIERWHQFVTTDWDSWDISEYFHDIGCRYWLQLFIENAQSETKQMIENALKPFDKEFQRKMKPVENDNGTRRNELKSFKENFYFWETHTIYE